MATCIDTALGWSWHQPGQASWESASVLPVVGTSPSQRSHLRHALIAHLSIHPPQSFATALSFILSWDQMCPGCDTVRSNRTTDGTSNSLLPSILLSLSPVTPHRQSSRPFLDPAIYSLLVSPFPYFFTHKSLSFQNSHNLTIFFYLRWVQDLNLQSFSLLKLSHGFTFRDREQKRRSNPACIGTLFGRQQCLECSPTQHHHPTPYFTNLQNPFGMPMPPDTWVVSIYAPKFDPIHTCNIIQPHPAL